MLKGNRKERGVLCLENSTPYDKYITQKVVEQSKNACAADAQAGFLRGGARFMFVRCCGREALLNLTQREEHRNAKQKPEKAE